MTPKTIQIKCAGALYHSGTCYRTPTSAQPRPGWQPGASGLEYVPLCNVHAAARRRAGYEIVPLEGDILKSIQKRAAEIAKAEAERAAERRATREQAHEAARVRAWEAARETYAVVRNDEEGDMDWDAYKALSAAEREKGVNPRLPAVPRWQVGPTRWSFELKIEREDGWPVAFEVRHSSSLNRPELIALREMIDAALAETEEDPT